MLCRIALPRRAAAVVGATTSMVISARPLSEVAFPALSPTMEQGSITEWSKKVGDSLGAGDMWGKVETDKATVDFKNQSDEGYVARILVDAGTATLKVGEIIALVVDEKGDIDSDEVKNWKPEVVEAEAATPAVTAPTPVAVAPSAPTAKPTAVAGDFERSGPAVHRVAAGLPKEKIATITPTGKDGRYVKADFAGITTIDYSPTGSLISAPASAPATATPSAASAVAGGSYAPGVVYNMKVSDKAILISLLGGRGIPAPKKTKVVEASA